MLKGTKISKSIISRFAVIFLIIGALLVSSCNIPTPTTTLSASMSSSTISSSLSSESSSATSSVSSAVSSMVDPVPLVRDYLNTLSVSNLDSGKSAIDFISANVSDATADVDKDTLLGLYLTFSYLLVFTLMNDDDQFDQLNTLRDTNEASFNASIAQNGLRTLEVDGSFVLVPDFSIIIATMSNILSANGLVYCGLMVSMHNLEPIASESGILVPLASLNQLQEAWDAFVSVLPAATTEFPASDSTYKGHFEARRVLSRLNGLLGIS